MVTPSGFKHIRIRKFEFVTKVILPKLKVYNYLISQVLCGAHECTEKAKYAEYMKSTSACEKVKSAD